MEAIEQKWKREWLTYREAAELVGLSRGTLHKLIKSGEVRATKVGKAVRIHRPSLERWMDTHSYANHERADKNC